MRWARWSEPRSAAGMWLIATLAGDELRAAEQRERLNEAPVADLAVLRLVFEALAVRAFGGAEASEVHSFASRLLGLPGAPDVEQLQVTAVIRAALGSREVKYRGFEVDRVTLIWAIVAYQLVRELRVSRAELVRMVRRAEETAEETFDFTLISAR